MLTAKFASPDAALVRSLLALAATAARKFRYYLKYHSDDRAARLIEKALHTIASRRIEHFLRFLHTYSPSVLRCVLPSKKKILPASPIHGHLVAAL